MTTLWATLAPLSSGGYSMTSVAEGNTPDPPDPPPDDTYAVSYDMRIFAGAIDEDTDNVLVVIDITMDDLKTTANGGEVLSAGNDIRFELEDGTGLGWYRKSWNGTTGNLVALVAFPTVTTATDTDFVLKIGLASAPDDQQVPALLGSGYLAIWDDDGTDLSGNGRDLTNSGTSPDTAFFSAAAYDGTAEQYTDAFGWLAGLSSVGIQILFRATAGMVGSNRGVLAIGPDLAGAGSYWGIRYRPTSISSGDTNPVFFSIVTANGPNLVETPASAQSAGEHIIFANYGDSAAAALNIILNGVMQTANVRTWLGGLTAAPSGRLYLGGGALDTDGGVRWQDRIGAAWIRASAYSLALAQFNTAMLWDSSGWEPWQIDTGGGYATPTARPEYAPVTPPDPAPDIPTLPTPVRTVNVSNVSQLAVALSSAAPGDLILLADGSYTGNFTASVDGTADDPIVIKAANTGLAIIAGRVAITGDYNWLWGVKIQDGGTNSGTINHVSVSGSYQKIVGIEVDGWGSTSNFTKDTFISLNSADNTEICYCKISNARTFKTDDGSSYPQWRFAIRGNDHPAFCRQIHVHHMHITGMPAKSVPTRYDSSQSDAFELAPTIPIPPGYTKVQDDWLIEYCLIEDIADGTAGSALDLKYGSWVTVRYMTFKNCAGYFDLRSTEQSIISHIWMDACGGMRVLGADHTIEDVKIFNGGTMQLLRGNAAVMDQTNYAQCQDVTVSCCQCTLQIGLQFSSVGTSFLPTGTTVNGHAGTVTIQSGNPTVTQNSGYSCDTSEAFELAPAQVGIFGLYGVTIADWAANPWNATSAARIPIGSGLTRSASTRLSTYYSNGDVVEINAENGYGVPVTLATTSDPEVTVTKVGGLTNDLPITCRIPAGFGTSNEATCIIQPDGRIIELYGFNRTALTASIGWDRETIYGKGHSTTTGVRIGVSAFYGSAMFGVLPVDILENEALSTETAIQWTLHIALPAGRSGHVDDLLSHSFQLPACGGDATAGEVANNTGPYPYGGRFTFATGFDYNTAVTSAASAAGISNATSIRMAKMVCAATYNYGLVVIDEGNTFAFRADRAFTTLQRKVDLKEILRRVLPSNINLITNGVSGATGLVSPGGTLSGVPGAIASPYGGGTGRAPNTGYAA